MAPSQLSAARLNGKVALVTGSGRGMGRQHALQLASCGASIIINYASNSSSAEKVVQEVKDLGQDAIAIKADISKPPQIKMLFEEGVKHFGKIDIVMSNSGLEHFGAIEDVTEDDFNRIFAVNTRGQFFVAQQAYKHLSDGGRLILTSSISAQTKSVANHAVYSGSKAAVEAFVRCFAHGNQELIRYS